jgi:hypothetical protein
VTYQVHEHVEHLWLDLHGFGRPAQLEQVGVELAVFEQIPHRQKSVTLP